MLVRKCDNCKKEIKQLNEAVVAGIGFPEFSFCKRCGKPIIAFLKKNIPSVDDTQESSLTQSIVRPTLPNLAAVFAG